MNHTELDTLRNELDDVNRQLLKLISERGELVQQIGEIKTSQGMKKYDPVRERHMLNLIATENQGPFDTSTLQHLFKEIFKAGLKLQEGDQKKALLVSRKQREQDTIVSVKGTDIGNGSPVLIAGPCAVESYEQTAEVADAVTTNGLKILRGGAFKPRTSPYDFQGLGVAGLKILKRVADEFNCAVISEIVHPDDLQMASEYLDIIQIGARNMQNYELLKAAGKINKPILLKRGLSATIEEFIHSAEYIMSQGNGQIILCERGIRTYERATRNTLDITAVPILKQETHLPVFVDVTHSTGRKDLLLPAAKAAFAIGADGVMTEVHPDPAVALSDAAQQMDIGEFNHFVKELVVSGYLKLNQMV
ncbi:bifunctional 3-deoxy-7-phosphoheptulonate synthase/chorismate mutase [Fictibacillus nanhaiensis]|uniref:bifunctional 3-deoxy-7-phosphoheptulonate synthase/chorismate mutase n=1 Tax=Fictibacillus nanhaiensis TaxID=742169 RepID=UPI001C98824E|nr:bifunctional 3-deoxy-7-phosphoheptulonate synthase/chorismate mutase [Fictibacillus nanhaiensis]MBY6035161.1 bifunctional 3-deoxy-7-phosphoheptulonate synthase/chorismate mutase [Fictibacillus nanhaiensis]